MKNPPINPDAPFFSEVHLFGLITPGGSYEKGFVAGMAG
jgi:hypothetical protein